MEERTQGKGQRAASLESAETRQLLRRHIQGDSSAFPQMIQHYQAQVYSYLVRCGIEGNTRDDLFQEIFLRVHLASAQYEPERPFEPWLFTIVANTVRSHFRKERVRELLNPGEWGRERPDNTTAEHMTEAKETSVWLETQLSLLPLAQREAVVICCLENVSQQDAAKILEQPLSTLKTNLHRGRAALARALADRKLQANKEAAE